jgi:hypothetical protein
MARNTKTITTYTDDLTREELAEDDAVTVEFSYGGTAYEIDLSKENAAEFDSVMEKYLDHARPIIKNARKTSTKAKDSRPTDYNKEERQAIREWGAAHGFSAGKGRLSAALVEAYNKANG